MRSRCLILTSVRRLVLVLLAVGLLLLSIPLADAQSIRLASEIDKTLNSPFVAHGIQGVLVRSLRDGRVVYEKNSNLAFVPASNMKLIVSAACLDLLGADYRMVTRLFVSGDVTSEGTLTGSLHIVGGGDPVLKVDHLKEMMERVKETGIRVINGDIVADDTLFDDIRLGPNWGWDDEPYYYAAQISALNLNKNVVEVWVRPGQTAGAPAVVTLNPSTSYMTISNQCVTSKAGGDKSVMVNRVHGQNIIRVVGSVSADYKPSVAEELISVDDPTLYTCHVLMEMLQREGVQVRGQIRRGACPQNARLVATHYSPPLSEIIAFLNKPSDNLIAECLLKTLGVRFKGKGTIESGIEVEVQFLKRIGLDMTAIGIVDGSGLSRQNLVSPKNLVALLTYMYRHKHSEIFVSSLPIAGVDGTLKNRMKGTDCEKNVWAKTGYLNRVSTISGFMKTKAGEPLVFSIMMNNHLCKNRDATAVQDRILGILARMDKQ